MSTFAVPLYAIIDAANLDEAKRAKAAVEQLLKNDAVRMMLASAGIRVRQMTVTDPYECEPPGIPAVQQQQPVNGRR